MIYFSPTVRALKAHIDDLKQRLADSETERKALLDRLLQKRGAEPIHEAPAPAAKPALQVIAPPGMALPDVQDAVRDVWIQEEVTYLMGTLGYEEGRAYAQAEQSYKDQHGS